MRRSLLPRAPPARRCPSKPVCAFRISAPWIRHRHRRQVRQPVCRLPVDPAPLRAGARQSVQKDQSRLAQREIPKRRAQFRSQPDPARDGGCVRPGLSLRPSRPPRTMSRHMRSQKTAPGTSPFQIYIDRTVRSRYILYDHTLRVALPTFARRNLSREAKPMVAPSLTTLHLVSDEETSKRRQILDGARKVFMDLGFDGASMGEIARSAGVSKGTLYVYFADKNRLFEAIVEQEMV